MGIQSQRRRKNTYKDIAERFSGYMTGSSGWLRDLINNSMANSYEGHESGAGISPADAFTALFNYKSMLEQMEFNRLMQEDAQAFNAEMQANSQAFNSAEAEKQRFWEEQMYNEYQSPEAMVQQYARAGLNPALAMTGGAQGPVSMNGAAASAGSGATSGAASAAAASIGDVGAGISNLPGGQLMMEMLGMFTQGIGSVSRIYDQYRDAHLKRSQQNYYDELRDNVAADTTNKRLEAQMREIDLQYADAFKQLGLTEAGVRMTNLDAQTQQYLAEVNLALSNVKVNEGRLKLLESETALNYKNIEVADQKIVNMAVEAALNNGRLHQIQELLVWQKNQLRAAAAKDDAAAQEALSRAEYTDAQTQQVLEFLNLGGIEEQIKGMKSERRRAVANCIIGNICNVANSVAGFLPQKVTSTTYTAPSTTRTEYYDRGGINAGSVITESTPSISTTTRTTQ